MVDRREELEPLHAYLVANAGGFLRNTKRIADVTCSTCTGIPNPGFPTCYKCGYLHDQRQLDRLGFVTYAWHPHQSGTVMRGYKIPKPAPTNKTLVSFLLSYAVVGHLTCMADPLLGTPTSWATVPSLPRRDGIHPLNEICREICQFSEVDIRAADPLAGPPRNFEPENFVVGSSTGHVLLIDDTWAGGGHIQSAAAAIKDAGASRVTALLLARWLEPTWGTTKDFIKDNLTLDFDPNVCPFTGDDC